MTPTPLIIEGYVDPGILARVVERGGMDASTVVLITHNHRSGTIRIVAEIRTDEELEEEWTRPT